MFTGIVTEIGRVAAVDAERDGLRRIRVASPAAPSAGVAIGASIACSGPA